MSTALQDLAAEAFIYGYPLVQAVGSELHFVSGPVSAVSAPVNTFGHVRELATPEMTRKAGVVSPNTDTLYSIAVIDVGPEPLVLRLPEMHDRYYVLQFIDAWTNNFAYVGRRSAGAQPGESLIVPPGWTGAAPHGMRVIHAPTFQCLIGGRVLISGEADSANAHRLQDAMALIPLSRYPQPPDLSARTFGDWPLPLPDSRVPPELAFWERLRTWARAFPPHPDDRAYQRRFEPLGLLAAESPYVHAGADLAAALQAGEAAGLATLEEQGQRAFTLRNTWQAVPELFNYNIHFFAFGTLDAPEWTITDPVRNRLIRAIAARQGLFGNHAYEAFYPLTFHDADGAPLSGAHRYVLHFDQPPPVDAFWSLTMYEAPSFYPIDNRINRYAIGDRTEGLRYNADGSLDIYLQQDAPAPDQESNWLPAPAGPFRPMLRLYNPRPEAFDDARWRLPAIQRHER
jgi:hypothetical protein